MAEAKPWRSGFCGVTNPPESHARCKGFAINRGEALNCSCDCHVVVVDEQPVATPEPGPRLGVYDGLEEVAYHADPTSVSASGMKTLLRSPAHFLHERTHPRTSKAMTLGTVAHTLVLGTGAEFVTVPPDLLAVNGAASTKEAKAFIAEATAAGHVVLKADELAAAQRMADAVFRHPTASALLTSPGRSEVSMFWLDPAYDVIRRCRWDRLGDDGVGVDLKTTNSAEPLALARHIIDFRYDMSFAWYLAVAAGLDVEIAAYALVFVESTEPHPVVVADPIEFLDRGSALATKALTIYRRCLDTGQWPAYCDDGFLTITPPRWSETADQIALTIPEGTTDVA